jgi:hypothetical protein
MSPSSRPNRRRPLALAALAPLAACLLVACSRSVDDWALDLRTGDALERRTAALALREVADRDVTQALGVLLEAVSDYDHGVRACAMESIRALAPRGVDALVQGVAIRQGSRYAEQQACAQALPSVGEAAVRPLVELLAARGKPGRANAVEVLAAIEGETWRSLVPLLDDPDPVTRSLAARTLGRIGLRAEGALDRLAAAAGDSAGIVRLQVVEALLTIAPFDARVLAALEGRLADPSLEVRKLAVRGLFAAKLGALVPQSPEDARRAAEELQALVAKVVPELLQMCTEARDAAAEPRDADGDRAGG